jgi:hypothetical protein
LHDQPSDPRANPQSKRGFSKFYVEASESLALYIRHVAWLHAAPEDAAGKRQKTRVQVVIDSGVTPSYPTITACDYLIGYLYEAGPIMSGGMGDSPLSHSEIRAWQDNTGTVLTAWEARLLRRLSREYLHSSQQAEKPNCPAPWGDSRDAANIHQAEMLRKIDVFLN